MYTFAVRDEGSSVYNALTKLIEADANWKRLKKGNPKANLIFLERNNQPFWKFGHQPGLKQLTNYYRGSEVICRKVKLVSVLAHHFALKNQDIFQWLPESFIIRPIQNLEKYAAMKSKKPRALEKVTDERGEFMKAFERHRNSGRGEAWIAKSSTGAKGEGIIISRSPDDLISAIENQPEPHIVQKYIEKPLLLSGQRKFDVRCWVVLDHEYNIHLMKEGVLRTSSDAYDEDNLTRITSHLTNHCIQEEQSANFGKYEEGNEMFFAEFDGFLKKKYGTSMVDKILPQIRMIVKECLLAIKEDINTDHLSYQSFQVFGFDFMIDAAFKVWLIEINGAPACAKRLLPQLTSGIFNMVIKQVFPSDIACDEQAGDCTEECAFETL
ncbi:tubulin--tyrosine ligase-like [Amphiura filiformis]|uniref:tubulin--tyrosine ligase-like n=1 Tax=Amphiura filiformis TaxID=82378 RepID=UPI003B213263